MKLIVAEQGSEEMVVLAASVARGEVVISALCRVEAASTISRLIKSRRMSAIEASQASDLILESIDVMTVQPLTPQVLENAATLASQRCLRALDAVQLASAIASRAQATKSDMRFVASDKQLLEAAHHEGFTTWNPCDG